MSFSFLKDHIIGVWVQLDLNGTITHIVGRCAGIVNGDQLQIDAVPLKEVPTNEMPVKFTTYIRSDLVKMVEVFS